ncbi:hypothetical protein ACOME3_009932 [Neoechinorhynchus agilis]
MEMLPIYITNMPKNSDRFHLGREKEILDFSGSKSIAVFTEFMAANNPSPVQLRYMEKRFGQTKNNTLTATINSLERNMATHNACLLNQILSGSIEAEMSINHFV